jgi:flagellar basal-body rod protein FlgC
MVHEPGNPQADKNGFVSYPAVDQAEEMTSMIRTSRAYEANIVALKSAGEMYSKALTLGERT